MSLIPLTTNSLCTTRTFIFKQGLDMSKTKGYFNLCNFFVTSVIGYSLLCVLRPIQKWKRHLWCNRHTNPNYSGGALVKISSIINISKHQLYLNALVSTARPLTSRKLQMRMKLKQTCYLFLLKPHYDKNDQSAF
jgi:hypothetical protein